MTLYPRCVNHSIVWYGTCEGVCVVKKVNFRGGGKEPWNIMSREGVNGEWENREALLPRTSLLLFSLLV